MVTVDELLARVAHDYEQLDPPSWADPHPGMRRPGDEEYSRLTDPVRYRVVHLRARVWIDVLREVLGAVVEMLPDPVVGTHARRFRRGQRVTASCAGTLALLLLEGETPEGLPVLSIGVLRPELVVAAVPDCGCDACDTGSADLLEAIDEAVVSVIGGPFVLLRGPTWQSQWHPDGAECGGGPPETQPDFAEVMEWSRRLAAGEEVELPPGVEAVVGRSWLG